VVSRTVLAIAIAVWTLLTWGGRIRLLTDADQADVGNWARIGGSVLVGAAAVAVLLLSGGSALERWVLTLFALWSVGLWGRSLVVVWTGPESTGFKAVHTVLAAGYLVLAALAVRRAWAGAA
jgi:hypothetical protein